MCIQCAINERIGDGCAVCQGEVAYACVRPDQTEVILLCAKHAEMTVASRWN